MQIFQDSIVSQFQKKDEHKENQTKYSKMTRTPQIHVRILIYRTWAIANGVLRRGYRLVILIPSLARHHVLFGLSHDGLFVSLVFLSTFSM